MRTLTNPLQPWTPRPTREPVTLHYPQGIAPGTYSLAWDGNRIEWTPREGETAEDAAAFFNQALARVKAPFVVTTGPR